MPHLIIPPHSAKIVRKIVRRDRQWTKRPLPGCPAVVTPNRKRPISIQTTFRESPNNSRSSSMESNSFVFVVRHEIRSSASVRDRSSFVGCHSDPYRRRNSSMNGETATLSCRLLDIPTMACLSDKTGLSPFSWPRSPFNKKRQRFVSRRQPKCWTSLA